MFRSLPPDEETQSTGLSNAADAELERHGCARKGVGAGIEAPAESDGTNQDQRAVDYVELRVWENEESRKKADVLQMPFMQKMQDLGVKLETGLYRRVFDDALIRLIQAKSKQEPFLAPDHFTPFTGEPDTNVQASRPAIHTLTSEFGFVEIFKKLFGGKGEEQEEAPTTSEQRKSAWQEEERHAEFAFCSDVGFRGLHPEEGGEEAACWSRCGRVCEGAMFLAEDALPEWRLVPVATRTKPCKTPAKKSAVQILCKAIKKPTQYDISSAVKQETTFDVEAQQQEQMQQLSKQQMLLQHQPPSTHAFAAASPGYLPEEAQLAPQTFAAAAYGRGRSALPQWALYLIITGVALLCGLILCCCLCFCRR
ncbi:uncharacterized protein EMH_0016130 [Eimeria mitis]|uniref:Transmembrane protein n=1 Tax=Eimeria mitis TaxID=44415 RepID=U6JVE8_9EIME|nr:uncharacterized protein EMH_0016130 [Eimeria mitis]CDJ28756.1 hypothetical protein, conserved [Eimeria mitis]